ncbi:uncharacterized protein LOC103362665 isoform X2 [Stegastes partitus]|uniref:Uncharacterized protein LOC103362665 isoform X2 n=1 Tax=Stegastes partitus TaxID=144197 RepID=A0A9Y4N866_9TELE|nr:PREDICTED: uncharacterized protein LOC103362665 isoform X2 [Stegastes partitus]
MFLYMLVFMAYHSSRWIPRNQRLKFQIVNAVFTAAVLVPQLYVMGRPKSSRYCRQPLLNNLSASIALSFIASGFSVIFTLMDPVPQSVWAAYHVFGLLSCGHGLCTAILTLTAAACVRKTIIVCFTIKQNPSQWFVCVSTGPNHPRAVPHVPDSNSGLDSEYRFFPGERRTVVDDEAPSNGPKPRLKRSSCPTSETAHIKNS